LFKEQLTIREGKTKIKKREGPQFVVQFVGHPDLFVSRLTHDNYFTFMVVDLEA
jgi:hypothetical protein